MKGIGEQSEPFGRAVEWEPADRERTCFEKSCLVRLTESDLVRSALI